MDNEQLDVNAVCGDNIVILCFVFVASFFIYLYIRHHNKSTVVTDTFLSALLLMRTA